MSAIEDLERRNETRFDEQTFVDFLDSLEPGFGWESGRWELIDGLPIEMPPATRRHGFIAQNLERLLAAAAPRPTGLVYSLATTYVPWVSGTLFQLNS